jgi:hypothetical protein
MDCVASRIVLWECLCCVCQLFNVSHLNLCLGDSVLLLQHPEINASLKDLEGYNPFDLYSLTLDRTIISSLEDGPLHLYTWRPHVSLDKVARVSSRNPEASIVKDNENVTIPKPFFIPSKEKVKTKDEISQKKLDIDARFLSVSLKCVAMTRSQICKAEIIFVAMNAQGQRTTALVTSENTGNLRICEPGIGKR